MCESRPSQVTAPDCQLITEQPGKDLQAMGNSGVVFGGGLGAAT
jgi:hypothetical protein